MAFKTAVGKKTTISKPAAGTLKTISSATSKVGITISKQSKSESDSVDRLDNAPPAEIVAISDFNRIYASGATLGKAGKTPYGLYYDALKSIHSLSTEDVKHIVEKALSSDVAAQWETLRAAVESDQINAADLVNDLAQFLDGVERAENSLDFGRSTDETITTAARDYLASRLKPYEKKPENRSFDPKIILNDEFENDNNSEMLKKMIGILREALTFENEKSYNDFIASVSQKRENDLNAPDGKLAWEYIDGLPDSTTDRLAACAELISHILSVSSGIVKVQNDPISEKISFKPSRLTSIFEGTESRAIPGKTIGSSPVPFKKTLDKVGPPSLTVSLSLLQFDGRDGKPVIPVEVDDPPKGSTYRSGPTALIRNPILDGEFTFSDLQKFSDKFEESRGDIETYLNLMIGQADPTNNLTPVEILRIIIRNFADGLDYSAKSFDSMLQLLAMKFSTGGDIFGGRDSAAAYPRQHILRSATRIKFYQLKSVDITSTDSDEGSFNQTLATTRTSKDSTSLKSDADVTTSQITSLSVGSNVPARTALGRRVIARLASVSPPANEVSAALYTRITTRSSRNAMSRQDINNKISSKTRELDNLKEKKAAAERELIAAVGVSVYAALLTGGLSSLAGGGVVVNNAIKKLKFYTDKVDAANEEINDLRQLLRDAVTFLPSDAARISLEESQKKTSGNFFSQIVKAYNEIVEAAESRLPTDELMTNDSGVTKYGNLDEFGLMSLVVECFVQLATLAQVSSEVDSRTNINSFRPSKGAVKSLRSDLITLTTSDDEAELGEIECDVGDPARLAILKLASKQRRVQDTLAYLFAFSQVLNESTDELISKTSDLLADASRRRLIDTADGRKLISSLTTQQIVYRRSLLERYSAKSDFGYVPSRVAYSQPEDTALDQLLASPDFSSRLSENKRIVTLAVPTGVINNEKRYVEKSIGEINRSGMLEIIVSRKDHELDDLIFKEKVFLFDPQLFVFPGSFDDLASQRSSSDSDIALSIAKRSKFSLHDRVDSVILNYADLKSNPRYSSLTSKQIDEIARNTVLSYLMETYLFKLCGSLFDECVSVSINSSPSQSGIAAVSSLAGLRLPDVILPSAENIRSLIDSEGEIMVDGSSSTLTTGDKELIANLMSSQLLRSDTLTNRVFASSKFDRVLSVVVDPDEFEIDRSQSIKQNGSAARSMLDSLRKQGLLVQKGSSITIRPRDPLAGGFSIGSLYCQFIPHTISSEGGTLLRLAKQGLTSRLASLPSVGLTSRITSTLKISGKSSKSITKSSKSKKIAR